MSNNKVSMQSLGASDWQVPRIVHGMMRLGELSEEKATEVLQNALDLGFNFFDHADIYCGGESELLFAKVMKKLGVKREDLILQSKCGIVRDYEKKINYGLDFSYEYIMKSVDGILNRLDTDYIDVLLLHRPDTLVEPEEVARAFDALETSGKVKCFGVSNQNPGQMELLKTAVKQPLIANQLQFGPAHVDMISSGLNMNVHSDEGCSRDNGVLEYCRINNVTIQAWSPLQYGMIEGAFQDAEDLAVRERLTKLNACQEDLAGRHGVSSEAIAIAWILRHPAKIQPVVGSMNVERLQRIADSQMVELSRAEWYDVYKAGGNTLP